jgi:hypothetical protein
VGLGITFRPLPSWPHKATASRQHSRFDTSYVRTIELLEREVRALGGREIVMGVGLDPHDIRLDGQPRANARAYSHPGVEISFDSAHGRLSYATDQYHEWQDNVRAIALSLEALRAVERWGVSKGRQYTGFAALTAGPSLEDLGRQLVTQHGSVTAAMRATHPDTGGPTASARDFQAVIAYRDSTAVAV